MTIKNDIDLSGEFSMPERTDGEHEIPERIKRHAPTPVLRPGGSWAKQADAVDQRVREQQDAAKARREWAKRTAVKSEFSRS